MDARTGEIRHLLSIAEEDKPHVIPMQVPPTAQQLAAGRVGRNDPCPCGSGKKFKKCHLRMLGPS
jgi:preprotein translocase subunit SecA